MKLRAVLLFGIASATLLAAQDSIKLERVYKAGDADKYALNIDVTMMAGQATVKMDLTQTVKKTYDNGDADIESATANTKLYLNGQEMPSDALGSGEGQKPITQRYDKFFRPVPTGAAETSAARGLMNQFSFMRYGVMLSGQEIKVGETIPVEFDSKDTKTSVTGTAKLLEIVQGVAKIQSSLKIKNPETGDKSIDLQLVSLIDTATSKPVKVEGTVSNIPNTQGVQIDAVKFVMSRS